MPRRLHINHVSRAGFAGRATWMLPARVVLQAAVLMLLSLAAAAQPAPNAHPAGGVVVGGTAYDQPERKHNHDRPDHAAGGGELAKL